MENFRENTNVIQLLSAEYTGPLHFVQFWLDVIKGWKNETGNAQIIGLSTTRDVQDAILADAMRSWLVDVIDIRYWHYQEDGKAYEPMGGQNLAPRQHARLLKPKRSSFEQVYRAVGILFIFTTESIQSINVKTGWFAFLVSSIATSTVGLLEASVSTGMINARFITLTPIRSLNCA